VKSDFASLFSFIDQSLSRQVQLKDDADKKNNEKLSMISNDLQARTSAYAKSMERYNKKEIS
jgi:hypothetical protein